MNTQWRYALAAYMRLFPTSTPRAARRFEMELSPRGLGPGGRCPRRCRTRSPSSTTSSRSPSAGLAGHPLAVEAVADAGLVAFTHPGGAAGVACEVVLRDVRDAAAARRRSASTGAGARRAIREPGYRLALATDDGPARGAPCPTPWRPS